METWVRILCGIAIVALLGVIVVNTPYYFNAAKSLLVETKAGEGPEEAPPGTHPLILLHGFNPTYSPRVAEFAMLELQQQLIEDLNYEDRNIYTRDITCAELQYGKEPIIIRASYLEREEIGKIEAYQKNLQQLIAHILTCSGAESVDIVAHSMGGIVARSYIREMEGRGIDPGINRLIMLGTPNHGGLYKAAGLSEYLMENGTGKIDIDFLSLTENNSYLAALNNGDETPGAVEYHTIAGEVDGLGDGVVRSESVPLEGSIAEHVPCSHNALKDPKRCPEAYRYLTALLKGE